MRVDLPLWRGPVSETTGNHSDMSRSFWAMVRSIIFNALRVLHRMLAGMLLVRKSRAEFVGIRRVLWQVFGIGHIAKAKKP